jgi:glutamate/tyrosine decarboxylase-like PLP-dependent enzyme
MKYLGEKGYLDAVRTIMETRGRLMDGVEDIDGLTVRGKPHIGLMSIGSDEYDVHAVADAMLARGWITGRGKEPNSIHLTLSPVHAAIHNSFLSDLAGAAAAVRSGQFTGSGEAAVYVG